MRNDAIIAISPSDRKEVLKTPEGARCCGILPLQLQEISVIDNAWASCAFSLCSFFYYDAEGMHQLCCEHACGADEKIA